MDKRFLLALGLTAIVIVVTPQLFPDANRRRTPSVGTDTTLRALPRTDRTTAPAETISPSLSAPAVNSSKQLPNTPPAVETTTVSTPRSSYVFSSRDAAPISVVLDSYPSSPPPLGAHTVQLVPQGSALLHYRVAVGADTVRLDTIPLRVESAGGATTPTVTYTGS